MQNPLFRRVALDQVSSPDQLDQLLRITNSRAWLGLLGLGAVVIAVLFWSFGGSVPLQASGSGILSRSADGLYGVEAPNFGTITAVPVQIGDHVAAGQEIATLKAQDGTQTVIASQHPGTILSLSAGAGSVVSAGQSIGVVDPSDSPLGAIIFIPASQAASIRPGMEVRIQPATAPADVYGNLLGTVESISDFPARGQRLTFLLQNDALVRTLTSGGPVYEVHVAVTADPSSPDGYKWSSGQRRGPTVQLTGGTLCTANVVIAEQSPRTLAFPESNH